MELSIKDFKWINKSEYNLEGDTITITALPKTDYFRNPINGSVSENAQFLYTEIEGDFAFRAKVKPNFEETFDACSLFVYADEENWIKTAFEATDLGTNAIVTVVTRGFSDDANSVNVEGESIYLQLVRKKDTFVCHYSFDGKEFMMARIFHFPAPSTLKVGFGAQSPKGRGGPREFSEAQLLWDLPENLRLFK